MKTLATHLRLVQALKDDTTKPRRSPRVMRPASPTSPRRLTVYETLGATVATLLVAGAVVGSLLLEDLTRLRLLGPGGGP